MQHFSVLKTNSYLNIIIICCSIGTIKAEQKGTSHCKNRLYNTQKMIHHLTGLLFFLNTSSVPFQVSDFFYILVKKRKKKLLAHLCQNNTSSVIYTQHEVNVFCFSPFYLGSKLISLRKPLFQEDCCSFLQIKFSKHFKFYSDNKYRQNSNILVKCYDYRTYFDFYVINPCDSQFHHHYTNPTDQQNTNIY